MHEEALLRDLRRELVAIARRERADRITRVALWVGALAHVSEQTVRERWAWTVGGTVAESARLEIEVSTDVDDPRAGGIVLTHVDVAEPDPGLRGRDLTARTGEGKTLDPPGT